MVDMLALDRPTVEDPRQSERSGPRKMSTPVIVARVLGAGYYGRVGPSLEDLRRLEKIQRQDVRETAMLTGHDEPYDKGAMVGAPSSLQELHIYHPNLPFQIKYVPYGLTRVGTRWLAERS